MILAGLGWGALRSGAKLRRIHLTPGRIIPVCRFGIWFERYVVIDPARARKVRFETSVQGLTEWDWHEDLPELELRVRGAILDQRYFMDCDPSEATWIVGALEHWQREIAGKARSG